MGRTDWIIWTDRHLADQTKDQSKDQTNDQGYSGLPCEVDAPRNLPPYHPQASALVPELLQPRTPSDSREWEVYRSTPPPSLQAAWRVCSAVIHAWAQLQHLLHLLHLHGNQNRVLIWLTLWVGALLLLQVCPTWVQQFPPFRLAHVLASAAAPPPHLIHLLVQI